MRDFAIGFDLDMTLVDSADAIARSLAFAAALGGAVVAEAEARSTVGLPLRECLARWLPQEGLDTAIDDFRSHYARHGIPTTTALPGAAAALRAVAELGGRSVVVTAKQPHQAEAVMQAAGLSADVVAGGHYGASKATVLAEHGAAVLVGDHTGDMAAAKAAGAVAVGVTSNVDDPAALSGAGADVVLPDLVAVSDWLLRWCLDRREESLLKDLSGAGSAVVAFSGGADSALVVAAAVRALGAGKVRAVTAVSQSLADGELEHARRFAEALGVAHDVIATQEMSSAAYRANDQMRCFHCKAELLDQLQQYSSRCGFDAVLTGTNADDIRSRFRPGIAAAAARGAGTPLADAGLTKSQVRQLSRNWGLSTADRPAKACLASRIRYGIEVTPRRLERVDRAETAVRQVLASQGIAVRDVRVRDRGDRATVEVDADVVEEVGRLPGLIEAVRRSGFERAEVDPRGFRSGSMNEGPATGSPAPGGSETGGD